MYKIIQMIILVGMFSSCTHSIHMVYHSDFKKRIRAHDYQPIHALGQQHVVMGFTQNTEYVDNAWEKLKRKCQTGQIEDVSIQFSTSHSFLSWTNKALIQAICHKR